MFYELQDDTLYNMTDNTEYQANLFAADLLIEDEEIEDMVQNEAKLIICRWRFRAISWRNKVNKDSIVCVFDLLFISIFFRHKPIKYNTKC